MNASAIQLAGELLAMASYILEVQVEPLHEDLDDIHLMVNGAHLLMICLAPPDIVLESFVKWEIRLALLAQSDDVGPPRWHRDHPAHPQSTSGKGALRKT